MFLINLKNMEERKAFCNLAIAMINADEKQEVKEITYLQDFIKEMIINNDIALEDVEAFSNLLLGDVSKEKLCKEEIDKNINVFLSATEKIKKTVLIELIALGNVDHKLYYAEQEILHYVADKFNFSKELVLKMQRAIIAIDRAITSAENLIQYMDK